MKIVYGDTETYCEVDLKKHGTFRYAAEAEIMIVQWAVGDGEPQVHDCTKDGKPQAFIDLLLDPDVVLVFHNVAFDRAVICEAWGIDVPIERWRDTMVKAFSHGLPGGLDKVGAVLGLEEDQAKDKRGRELIRLFCMPRPKNQILRRATRETHPTEWREFVEYSRQDVVAMRNVDRRLPEWNYRDGHSELALWHLDQRVNSLGFAVDVGLAEAAIRAVATEQARLKAQLVEETNGLVSSPSKRDQLLTFILAEYGVTLPDMKADTLRRRMEDPELPEAVKLLLSIRLEATKTSTAKYKTVVNMASTDGRMRNTLQFAGAQRTARWAGRGLQPQNLPRPTPDFDGEMQEMGVEALKGGFADVVFNDVMQLTSNAVRGCIVAPAGKKLCVADLSNIEGRGLAFLAGERWKLRAFAEFDEGKGADLYKLAYARSFNVSPEDVNKTQRQIGKVQELGLGYEGGVAAFLTFAAVYQMDLDDLAEAVWSTASAEALDNATGMLAWVKKQRRSTFGLTDRVYIACELLKASWREAHPETKELWKSASEAVKLAIANPGRKFPIGMHLKVQKDGAWLRIRLPSGRYLCYLQPKVENDQITYMGVNQYTRQWSRIKTYGGKLIENCTQAFARDVMAHNMPRIDAAGYEIVLTVHDEILTETPDTGEFSSDELASMMATAPPWAQGLPLAAAGFECTRYRKD